MDGAPAHRHRAPLPRARPGAVTVMPARHTWLSSSRHTRPAPNVEDLDLPSRQAKAERDPARRAP